MRISLRSSPSTAKSKASMFATTSPTTWRAMYTFKFREEEHAAHAVRNLTGRFYASRPVIVDFSPVIDFQGVTCRQYKENICNHRGCNFMHLKRINCDLRHQLFEKHHKRNNSSHDEQSHRNHSKKYNDRDHHHESRRRKRKSLSPKLRGRSGSPRQRKYCRYMLNGRKGEGRSKHGRMCLTIQEQFQTSTLRTRLHIGRWVMIENKEGKRR
ncbi:hypothetical protein V8G54_026084 [Vigna mungo]|uniref:C3H1-type domain-containing protein n=1 Tax=Vigna mungo TaxID=3915 RepID=A0AAQ3MY48_VIGMU